MTERGLTAVDAAGRVLEARQRGASVMVALVLDGPHEGNRRMRIRGPAGDGASGRQPSRSVGTLDSPALEAALDDLMDARIEAPSIGTRSTDAGTQELALPGADRPVRIYLERTRPSPGLLIVGAGHIAAPLHIQGALLGFRVTIADDRPEFAVPTRFPRADRVVRVDFSDPFVSIPPADRTHVVLVTRGHRYDYECLRRLLRLSTPPRYVGMIGSRRRVRATFHQLLEEGISRDRIAAIHAPVGLDLGAETPEEIAVAVAAEWVALARGGTGRPLSRVERIMERFFSHESTGAATGSDHAPEDSHG